MSDLLVCACCLETMPAHPQARRYTPKSGGPRKLVHRSHETCVQQREARYLRLVDQMLTRERAEGRALPTRWWVVLKLEYGASGYLDERPGLAQIVLRPKRAGGPKNDPNGLYEVRWEGGGYFTNGPGGFYAEAVYSPHEYPDWDAMYVHYYCTHNTPEPATEPLPLSYGWVAPAGAFHACDYAGHDGLGDRLAAVHYGTRQRRELERRGWLAVTDDGLVLGWRYDEDDAYNGQTNWYEAGRPMTAAQLDTLAAIAAGPCHIYVRDEARWRKQIYEAIARANGAEPPLEMALALGESEETQP